MRNEQWTLRTKQSESEQRGKTRLRSGSAVESPPNRRRIAVSYGCRKTDGCRDPGTATLAGTIPTS